MVDFDVRSNRVMVSLGPLTQRKYCTYSCPFCYVLSDSYSSYPSLSIPQIIEWIKNVKKPYDIIYVSGDTDSFAPPRTEQGIRLLEALCDFNVDVLFTTRTLLSDKNIEQLRNVKRELENKGRLLFGCVSISQLHHPNVEPHPIPTPHQRIKQLKKFKDEGIISVLAMRPFLPIIPISEYAEIINLSKTNVDIILGSAWYLDLDKTIENQMFKTEYIEFEYSYTKIDFHESDANWKVFYGREIESQVENICFKFQIPFFMRSSPAIKLIRIKKSRKFKNVVFDLDNTLYSSNSGVSQNIDKNVIKFIQKKLKTDYITAQELSNKYQAQYGLAIIGLEKDYHIDVEEFFDETHNIDYQNYITSNPLLPSLLSKVPIAKSIFSNGPKKHVENILKHLKIRQSFDMILDLNSLEFNPKPSMESYNRLLDLLRCPSENIIIIDDNPNNLLPAKKMGMTTILVANTQSDFQEKVDFVVADITKAISLVINLVNY